MTSLAGRTALVTGAARGQGRSHALALAAEGVDVVLCDIADDVDTVQYSLGSSADLDETVALAEKHGVRAIGLVADMRSTEDVEEVVRTTIAAFGRIDILVANHGVISFAAVDEISDQAWATVLDTNLTGIFKITRAVVPHMRAQGYGRIVATASSIARNGRANCAAYGASKWGVLGFVKACAEDLAGTGITVNALCPTVVETGMVLNETTYQLFCPDIESPTREDFETRLVDRYGPGRFPPEEVSRALLYIVSDERGVLTGQGHDISYGANARISV